MLLFDLPDYSKSSAARREKLARASDRPRERDRGGRGCVCGGGDLQGPDIHPVSPLSQILPRSLRASRRFGACVMCKSDETQLGQSLIWQPGG